MIHIDSKYIRLLSSQLDHFKQKSGDLYNFRCPICGDSEKNTYKARGYVYRLKDALIYKCHNCGDSRSLGNLIKHIDPTMHGQYVMEKYKTGPKDSLEEPTFEFPKPIFTTSPPNKLLEAVGAVCLIDLPEDHSSNQFIRNRKIPLTSARGLYYIDDEEKLEGLSPKYKDRIVGHNSRILLPFCDQDGNMTGLTGRIIDNNKGLRYLALKFNADNEPLIVGLEKLDGRRHTYVVEGPIDSLFIGNCLAVGGADFGHLGVLVDKATTTIIFDNEPRNKEIVKRMEKIISDGWNICIWPEKILEKDINDMVTAGQTPEEIQGVINRNSLSGLKAKFKMNGWKKC